MSQSPRLVGVGGVTAPPLLHWPVSCNVQAHPPPPWRDGVGAIVASGEGAELEELTMGGGN